MGGRRLLLPVLLLFALAVGATPRALQIDGASFAPRVAVGQGELPLRGAGTLRYGLFFKVYVAALYADSAEAGAVLDADTARRLEIVYFVDIDRDAIATFAERRLREQLGEAQWAALAPRLRAWHDRFRDVRAGDRYVMQYSGGRLSLALNGEPLANVADPQLAAAYFGLWLGPQPIDEELRAALLGGTPVPDA